MFSVSAYDIMIKNIVKTKANVLQPIMCVKGAADNGVHDKQAGNCSRSE